MEFRRVLFRSARGRGTEVGRTEVAVAVDQGVAQREVLRHADEGVVDAAVAWGVVLAHPLAGDAGALHVRPVGAGPELVHPVEDPAVHRLQAITGIGQGPGGDDRHRVVEEGALHLLLDLDRLDGDVDGALAVRLLGPVAAVVRRGVGVVSHQMSRNLVSLALFTMNALRSSTTSPMSVATTSSASAACSMFTRSSVRSPSSMVVTRSSSASISPRPFRRAKSFWWFGLSRRNWAFALSSFRYTFAFDTSVAYSGGWLMKTWTLPPSGPIWRKTNVSRRGGRCGEPTSARARMQSVS